MRSVKVQLRDGGVRFYRVTGSIGVWHGFLDFKDEEKGNVLINTDSILRVEISELRG